jgi:hypothetical protein
VAEEVKSDQGWKEQAQAEKERLARELDGQGGEGGAPAGMPPADLMTLVSGLATQALASLGVVPDPLSGKQEVNLQAARYNIDLIGALEEKTRGNLSSEEEKAIKAVLSDLRMRYVSAASPGGAAPEPGQREEQS